MLKRIRTPHFSTVLVLWVFSVCAQAKESDLKLWYNTPASDWNAALPIGNGRLGAMVFGNPGQENIQLNEATLWCGGPNRNDNPNALGALATVRSLIFEGKFSEAQSMANSNMITTKSHGMPFQTVGNLRLNFPGHSSYSKYYRELDIENAINTTKYTVAGVDYQREIFTSFTDDVIVMRITASQEGKIGFTASMDRPSPSIVSVKTESDDILKMTGFSSEKYGIAGQVEFQSRLKIVPEGGTLTDNGTSITLAGANSVILYISIATNFLNYNDISADPHQRASDYITHAESKSYTDLLTRHTEFYQNLFKRVSLDLGTSSASANPTNTRISQFDDVNDPSFAALYFQFGRYLLISSSQPGGQTANLQGIWCNELFPPWKSAYTININTEMNYWPAEATNLSEMHDPLIDMVKDLSITGQKTAADMYGAEGWVTHHNTDIWRICGPVDKSWFGMWPTGGVWLAQHLWEKFWYSGDLDYLQSVYPAMKGSAEFCLSFLTEEPDSGWLVMSPSMSPEDGPTSRDATVCAGTTIDNQLVFDILTKTAKAADLLNVDPELIEKIENTLPKLVPMQIGQYTQLQEWMQDLDDPTSNYKHINHAYGLFPSNQISPYHSPELFEAVKNSITFRGDGGTGWSKNWKINFWARLLDAKHAYTMVETQITTGTYTNMFDKHPPFQIDGNFGFTSGVTEMLLQSHDGAIHLLPALPGEWNNGTVTGLRARGGFEITSMNWENGAMNEVSIFSSIGGNCRIRSYTELEFANGTNLEQATAENSNTFYTIPEIKAPLISSKANLKGNDIKQVYEYDVPTNVGETITLVRKYIPVENPPSNVDSGVNYWYYEGAWDRLPDFSDLSALSTGLTDSINLEVAAKTYSFALVFEGYVAIDTTNEYTFYLSSDEGSRLYIDGFLLIDNDGLHAVQEKSGTMDLKEGYHQLRVEYFEQDGAEQLALLYQSTNMPKQKIDWMYGTSFCQNGPVETPPDLVSGINYAYYEGTWTSVPDFSSLTPLKEGLLSRFSVAPRRISDYFGFEFNAYLNILEEGDYTFYTASDDGSRLFIDDMLVVDNDGTHGVVEKSGKLCLVEGYHKIKVQYFDNAGDNDVLTVQYAGPGIAKRSIDGLLGIYMKEKQDQEITFTALKRAQPGDEDFSPGATVNSGLALTYESSNEKVASIVNGMIHVVGIGLTTITAFQNEGNDNYYPATPVSQNLIVVGDGEVNFALGGIATQSSTGYNAVAARAIDGNTSGDFGDNSVTHTSTGGGQWWQVDLQASVNIGEIKIYNRTDCCSERLGNFTVTMLNENGTVTFTKNVTTYPNPMMVIDAKGASGQIVKITTKLTDALALAEVEVYESKASSLHDQMYKDVHIYPNPMTDELSIEMPFLGQVELTMTDFLGRTVMHKTLDSAISLIDVRSLSNGIYLVRIKNDGLSLSQIIIKK